MSQKKMENIKNGIIINGEVYEAKDKDKPFCENCAFDNKHLNCNGLCEIFEKLAGNCFTFCMFQKMKKVEPTILENIKPLDSDISKLVDNNFFDLI